jgi:hypothetical protein
MQGFDDQKFKEKNYNKKYFFYIKTTIYLFPGLHKGRQSYRRSLFSPEMRTFSSSKHELYKLFPIFVGNFFPPVSGSETVKTTIWIVQK